MKYWPMLLQTGQPFSHESYIFEPKFDGIRMIATRFNGNVQLWTRHGLEITDRFPELRNIPVNGDVVLDCELIVLNEAGQDDFELCMSRFHSRKKQRREAKAVVFDILHYQNQDLRRLPLMDRKNILDQIFHDKNSPYTKIMFIDGEGERLFSAVQEQGMEGVGGQTQIRPL